VFDRELGTVTFARTDAELRAAVTSGRPVNVIELGPRLEEILDAFTRWAAAPSSGVDGVRRHRQPRSA
jgi:hypothetical protein